MMRAVYMPMRLLKVRNKVAFFSRQSDDVSADFALTADELRKRNSNLDLVILSKKLTSKPGCILSYPFHIFRQMYHLASSKVIVTDSYCIAASVLTHKKETTLIQIWHASSAIKKFGWQTVGKNSGHSKAVAEAMHMHEKYDAVLAPSIAAAGFFSAGFNVDMNKIKYIGLPHLTALVKSGDESSARLRRQFEIPDNKEIVLYIPTFRKGKHVRGADLFNVTDKEKYAFVFKPHPLDETGEIPDGMITDSENDTYDWLKAADIVISDYSALVIESALLGKKLYLYLYDEDEYRDDPGLNIILENESVHKAIFRSEDEFREIIDKPYDFDALKEFSNKYIEIDPSSSLEDFVAFIEEAAGSENK